MVPLVGAVVTPAVAGVTLVHVGHGERAPRRADQRDARSCDLLIREGIESDQLWPRAVARVQNMAGDRHEQPPEGLRNCGEHDVPELAEPCQSPRRG